jgi:hypothetical protein
MNPDHGQMPPDDEGDPFWITMRAGLAAPGTAATPAPRDPARLAEGLLRRHAWEQAVARRRWRGWVAQAGAVAVAACVGIAVGWRFHPATPAPSPPAPAPQPVAWFEDGGPAMAPSQDVGWASYMPRGAGGLDQTSTVADRPHPWLGIWTRPVQQFTADGGRHSAHLIVRVAGGSPAWVAGLRPGDVLTALDDCSLATPDCIGAHLSGLTPGTPIKVAWWDAHAGVSRQATIRLDALHE